MATGRDFDGFTPGNFYARVSLIPAESTLRGSDAQAYKGLQAITTLDAGITKNVCVNVTYFGEKIPAMAGEKYVKGATEGKFQATAKFMLLPENKSMPSIFAGYAQRINGGSFAYGLLSKRARKFLGQDTSFYTGVTVETNNVDNYASHSDPTPVKKSAYLWGGVIRSIGKNQNLGLEFDGISANLGYRIQIKKIDLELKAYGVKNTKFGASLGYSFDL